MTLQNDTVTVQAIDFDFSEGIGETWDLVYPDIDNFSAEYLRQIFASLEETDSMSGEQIRDFAASSLQAGELFQEFVENSCDPAMNFAYPIPVSDHNEAQARILEHAGCVTLVTIGGEPHLALTGGGMDMSWDICGAYVVLGFLPPLHFCDLPHFAGLRLTAANKEIMDACIRSAELAALWANNAKDKLEEYREDLRQLEVAWQVKERSGATLEN